MHIVYILSDGVGMSEDDIQASIYSYMMMYDDFVFEKWFDEDDFIEKEPFYRLKEFAKEILIDDLDKNI